MTWGGRRGGMPRGDRPGGYMPGVMLGNNCGGSAGRLGSGCPGSPGRTSAGCVMRSSGC